MFNHNAAFVTFADAVEANQGGLELRRASLLQALAARRTAGLNRFPRRDDDLRANLRACFADRAIGTLAAICWIASAQAEWQLMVEDHWDGSPDEMVNIGRLIVEGERDELNNLGSGPIDVSVTI